MLEYALHRFLFHIDELLPDRPFFLMIHFLLHGIHHYLPMDRCVAFTIVNCDSAHNICSLRLVMPPILFGSLQMPFTRLGYVLFPTAVANGIISGAFTFCKSYLIVSFRGRVHTSAISNRCPIRLHALRVSPSIKCIFYPSFVLIVILLRLHHTMLPNYMKEMKKYHLAHHYKNFELGFGVTSAAFFCLSVSYPYDFVLAGKIWDVVFNTVLPV